MAVVVRGEEKKFHVTEWQMFAVDPVAAASTPPPEPRRIVLQGEPRFLERFATARAGQTVTILAERRPGSSDLFVLALDRCPP